jgi:hypothetical protein
MPIETLHIKPTVVSTNFVCVSVNNCIYNMENHLHVLLYGDNVNDYQLYLLDVM